MRAMSEAIVKELMRLQSVEGMSSADFARHIGMDPGEWSRCQRGLRNLGMLGFTRALVKYPHLAEIHAQAVTKR